MEFKTAMMVSPDLVSEDPGSPRASAAPEPQAHEAGVTVQPESAPSPAGDADADTPVQLEVPEAIIEVCESSVAAPNLFKDEDDSSTEAEATAQTSSWCCCFRKPVEPVSMVDLENPLEDDACCDQEKCEERKSSCCSCLKYIFIILVVTCAFFYWYDECESAISFGMELFVDPVESDEFEAYYINFDREQTTDKPEEWEQNGDMDYHFIQSLDEEIEFEQLVEEREAELAREAAEEEEREQARIAAEKAAEQAAEEAAQQAAMEEQERQAEAERQRAKAAAAKRAAQLKAQQQQKREEEEAEKSSARCCGAVTGILAAGTGIGGYITLEQSPVMNTEAGSEAETMLYVSIGLFFLTLIFLIICMVQCCKSCGDSE